MRKSLILLSCSVIVAYCALWLVDLFSSYEISLKLLFVTSLTQLSVGGLLSPAGDQQLGLSIVRATFLLQ